MEFKEVYPNNTPSVHTYIGRNRMEFKVIGSATPDASSTNIGRNRMEFKVKYFITTFVVIVI